MSEQLQSGLSHEEQSLSSPSPERLRAWRLYFESALALLDVLDAEMERDAGIPIRWYDLLVHLEDEPGGLRMNELAERILYSKSGFTRVVDRMEEAGLVRRERPENDRRSFLVVLTDEGRKTMETARAAPSPCDRAALFASSVRRRRQGAHPGIREGEHSRATPPPWAHTRLARPPRSALSRHSRTPGQARALAPGGAGGSARHAIRSGAPGISGYPRCRGPESPAVASTVLCPMNAGSPDEAAA